MNIQEIASASSQIKELLTPLADKIGQTGQYVFSLFVRQVYVNALTGLLWLPVGVIIFWGAKKLYKMGKEVDSIELIVTSIFLIVIGLITVLVPLADLIQAIINPEFQVIKLIIVTLKSTQ